MNRQGPIEERGWSATGGEPLYHSQFNASVPQKYIPYGGMALNAIIQHLEYIDLEGLDFQPFFEMNNRMSRPGQVRA